MNRRNTDNEVLGDGGLGLEYRFTPYIGLFSDVRYNVDESKNNFLSTRIGLRRVLKLLALPKLAALAEVSARQATIDYHDELTEKGINAF